ncbi:serine/threonine protein kinase, partial [Myxococcus sp. 1LA]
LEPASRPAAAPVAAVVRERPSRPEPRSEGRMARVRFVVHPWAEVTCGGKRLGETPFEAVELRVAATTADSSTPTSRRRSVDVSR